MEKITDGLFPNTVFLENSNKYSEDFRDGPSLYHSEYDAKYNMSLHPEGTFSLVVHAIHTSDFGNQAFHKKINGIYFILKNDSQQLQLSLNFFEEINLEEKESSPKKIDELVFYYEKKWRNKKGFIRSNGSYFDFLSDFKIEEDEALFSEELAILNEMGMTNQEENIQNLIDFSKPGQEKHAFVNFLTHKYKIPLVKLLKFLKKQFLIYEPDYKTIFKLLVNTNGDALKAFELWKPEYGEIKTILEENNLFKDSAVIFEYLRKGLTANKLKNQIFPNFLRNKYKESLEEIVNYYELEADEELLSLLDECGGNVKKVLRLKSNVKPKLLFKKEIEQLLNEKFLDESNIDKFLNELPTEWWILEKYTIDELKLFSFLIKNEKEFADFKVILRFATIEPITIENNSIYQASNKDPYLTAIQIFQKGNGGNQPAIDFSRDYEKYKNSNTNEEIFGAMTSFILCNKSLEEFKDGFCKETGKSLSNELAIRILAENRWNEDFKLLNENFFGERRKELYKINEKLKEKFPACSYDALNLSELYSKNGNIYKVATNGLYTNESIFKEDVFLLKKEFPEFSEEKILKICLRFLDRDLKDLVCMSELVKPELNVLRKISNCVPDLLKKMEIFDWFFQKNSGPNSQFYELYLNNEKDFFVALLKMNYPKIYDFLENLNVSKVYLLSALENLKFNSDSKGDNLAIFKERIKSFQSNYLIYAKKELSLEETIKIFAIVGDLAYSLVGEYYEGSFSQLSEGLQKKDEFLKQLKSRFGHLVKEVENEDYHPIILSQKFFRSFFNFNQIFHDYLEIPVGEIFQPEIGELSKTFPKISKEEFLDFFNTYINQYDDSQKENAFAYFKMMSEDNKKKVLTINARSSFGD